MWGRASALQRDRAVGIRSHAMPHFSPALGTRRQVLTTHPLHAILRRTAEEE
jgi:hypothetical protein